MNLHKFLIILFASFLLFSCSKEKKEINTLKDAERAVIGVMTGSTGEQAARIKFPNAVSKSFDGNMDDIAALLAGQVDAVISDHPSAVNICKHNPEIKELPEALDYENIAIAINKSNTELFSKVNAIVKEFKADGTLDEMHKRWLGDESRKTTVKILSPTSGQPLRIGVTASLEPFCYRNEKQEIIGHDPELAYRISVKLNRPVEFIDIQFASLIMALQSGKIDMILTGMTATKERMKYVNFTEPYVTIPQVMMVKKSQSEMTAVNQKMKSLDDIKTKKIGIILGSFQDAYVRESFPQAKLLEYKSPSDLFIAVKTEKIDIALYTHETLLELFRTENEFGFLEESINQVPVGIGFNKNNAVLRGQFNSFLKEIKANGVHEDMKKRWMDQGITDMPEIKNTGNNGVLVMGTVSDKGLPFTTVKNNKMIGFDVELVERFAAYLGKKLQLVDMEFGSLIAAANTNKIDAVVSTLVITEERKKQIDFSDPYYDLGTSLFGLKKNIAKYDNLTGSNKSSSKSFLQKVQESFYNNIILENRYLLIVDGLMTTIIISLLATIFGTLLGALICLMRMSRKKIVQGSAKIYISVLRGTPVLVVLMIIFYVIFASVNIDPVLVAVLAFGLNFAAYVSEMFRTGIESVDKGQTEAGIALGFTKIRTFIYIIVPQAVKRIMPVYKGELISLVKMTSIVGYIAVQDLTKASDIIRSRTFDAFFPLIFVAVMYFIIAWVLMVILGYFEKISDPKVKAAKIKSSVG